MDANSASAILFPGQGVGDPSSREAVADLRPDLLGLATELVGEDPFERMSEGTAYAQPAVYCASIAGFERLGRPEAEYFAGHSLGEIGALAAAGAIDDADGLGSSWPVAGSWTKSPAPVSRAACSPWAPTGTPPRVSPANTD